MNVPSLFCHLLTPKLITLGSASELEAPHFVHAPPTRPSNEKGQVMYNLLSDF